MNEATMKLAFRAYRLLHFGDEREQVEARKMLVCVAEAHLRSITNAFIEGVIPEVDEASARIEACGLLMDAGELERAREQWAILSERFPDADVSRLREQVQFDAMIRS